MAMVLGKDGIAYYNTGTYEAPVWVEVGNIINVVLNMDKASADVSSRSSGGWRERKGTLKDGTVESEMIYDPADPAFIAIQAAYFADDVMEWAFMDGDITTAGSQGLRATFDIGRFSRNEQLEDAMRVPLELWVSKAENPAEWWTVP